jgi:acetyltransferase-like isoleucine patch superfamily enzyme
MIRQRVQIADGALVGIGAVVLRDVAAGATVVGNPARLLVRAGVG